MSVPRMHFPPTPGYWVKERDYLKAKKQLREALSNMLNDYVDACDEWDHENQEYGHKLIAQARKALKETEE